jgi:DegV family protein with EDD domain
MKFVVTAENNCDLKRSWLEKNNVPYICTPRICDEVEYLDCFDTDAEFDAFYKQIKAAKNPPTTAAINPTQYREFFESVIKAHPNTPIVHVALSSGLSNACQNAIDVAKGFGTGGVSGGNAPTVTVIDCLTATLANGEIVEEIVKMRDAGVGAEEATEKINEFKMHSQGWIIMTDLKHLKRGGRISPAAAAIGGLLNVRPIIHVSKAGKLAVAGKARGDINAVKYVIERVKTLGNENYNGQIWVARTTQSALYDLLLETVKRQFPHAKVRTGIIGSVIGTHLGFGGVGVLFHGAERLDIK